MKFRIGVAMLGHRKRLLMAIAALETSVVATTPHAPSREADRRQLTVMFCDLVGSTALSEKRLNGAASRR